MSQRRLSYEISSLREAVKVSFTWSQVHSELGLAKSGSSYKALQRSCLEHLINTDHFTGQAWDRKALVNSHPNWGGRTPLTDILKEGTSYPSSKLKKRLVREGLFVDKCNKCGIGPIWNDEKLVLQLNHINGKHNDNRIQNLEILCPNCHTQTPTWGSKRGLNKK